MTPLPADLEALMPEPIRAFRDKGTFTLEEYLFTADQVRQAILAATERAAKIAQAKLDGEDSGVQDDWTADGGWDWACMQIRDAIRGGGQG